MIEYLIKSGFILIILLVVYHLWLEKEKMHRFNRFFLLGSVLFSLTAPLITVELPPAAFGAIELPALNAAVSKPIVGIITPVQAGPESQPVDYTIFLLIYAVVAATLLSRFTLNLVAILSTAARNTKRKTEMGTIVLLKEKVVPHSFLQYTFLNEKEYLQNKVEVEVLTHEFAHISQKHSIDLLLVETLKAIFWFNPVFSLYKKAIQLNHEFLADEAVISSAFDVSAYQHLLLEKAGLHTVELASNLNYSITKLRFQMMKKQTSKTRKMIKGLSLVPVAAILLLVFSGQILAQGTSATTELTIKLDRLAQSSKDEYYKGAYMRFTNKTGVNVMKRYEELTAEEKNTFPPPLKPTDELMTSWKDTTKFIVLIGYEKPIQPLSDFQATDFVSYYASKSESDGLTSISLIKRDWLENIKKLGGQFNKEGNQLFLAPPPPVVASPKNK